MSRSVWRRRVADWVYVARGTRGLTFAAAFLLALAALEPFFAPGVPNLVYMLPLLVVLVVALATLPREAVAVQARARAVLEDAQGMRRMSKRAVWGAAVCVSLFPNLFLAVQGIPHLSPLAGLLLPEMVRWVGILGLFGVLLLCVFYLRSSRSYAPQIATPRLGELDERDVARRDTLAVSLFLVVVAWGWMLQGFWRPFSLLQWNGADLDAWFSSLALGARGVAGIVFAVVPPALLFIVLSAHLDLLWTLRREREWGQRRGIAALAALHVVLCVTAVALHAYNVLWIVRYRSLGFL